MLHITLILMLGCVLIMSNYCYFLVASCWLDRSANSVLCDVFVIVIAIDSTWICLSVALNCLSIFACTIFMCAFSLLLVIKHSDHIILWSTIKWCFVQ